MNPEIKKIITDMLSDAGVFTGGAKYDIAAIENGFANPNVPCDLYDYVGLSAQKLAAYFLN